MARSTECADCGYEGSFDDIATADAECPKCGAHWAPKYDRSEPRGPLDTGRDDS